MSAYETKVDAKRRDNKHDDVSNTIEMLTSAYKCKVQVKRRGNKDADVMIWYNDPTKVQVNGRG
jgi:hypothetical protein